MAAILGKSGQGCYALQWVPALRAFPVVNELIFVKACPLSKQANAAWWECAGEDLHALDVDRDVATTVGGVEVR